MMQDPAASSSDQPKARDADGEDAILSILEGLSAAIERGEAPDLDRIEKENPAIAGRLRESLDALRFLGMAPGRLAPESTGDASRNTVIRQLGDFQNLREIGRGGMGVVYEAEQISLGRRVALKVLPFAAILDDRQLQRFRNEAQAAAALHHSNIVPIFAVGCERGVHYYAMQFIEGKSLAEVIVDLEELERLARGSGIDSQHAVSTPTSTPTRQVATGSTTVDPASGPGPVRGPTFFRSVARLGAQAADALQHAHEIGVLHRDVKPSNLMVDDRGHLWVTDFGLAKLSGSPGLTLTGDVVGTLRYMAPEQALGKRGSADHRADVYSLGATLYELATLSPVFEGRDREELLRRIAFESPRPPRKSIRTMPRELEAILLKALSKEPVDRYATAGEFAGDLSRFLDGQAPKAKRMSLSLRSLRWAQRQPAKAALIAIVLLTLPILVALTGWYLAKKPVVDAMDRQAIAARCDQLLEKGYFRLAHGATADAIPCFETALQLVPDSAEAFVGLALSAKRANDPQMVVDVLDAHPDLLREIPTLRALKYGALKSLGRQLEGYDPGKRLPEPATEAGYFAGGVIFEDKGLLEVDVKAKRQCFITAEDCFYQAIFRSKIPRALYHLRLAAVSRYLDDQSTARRTARVLTTQWPQSAQAWAHAGFAVQPFDPARAISLYETALQLDPDDALILQNYASVLMSQGRAEDAIAVCRRALGVDPKASATWQILGSSLRLAGRLDEALTACEKGFAIEPIWVRDNADYRRTLTDLGRSDEVIASLDQMLRRRPDLRDLVYREMAVVHVKRGDDVKALEFFQKGSEAAPESATPHLALAQTFRRLRRNEEALVHARRAVELDPKSSDARAMIGELLTKLGRHAAAEEALWSALSLKPDSAVLHDSLGHLYLAMERIEDASQAFRRTVELDPAVPFCLHNLGVTLLDLGRPDEAVPFLQRAIEKAPHDLQSRNELAGALLQSGRFDEALEAVENVKAAPSLSNTAQDASRLAGLARKFDEMVGSNLESIDLPTLRDLLRIAEYRKRFAAGVKIAEAVLAGESATSAGYLARHDASRCAALAGCGKGDDAASLGQSSRQALRSRALALFREELSALRAERTDGAWSEREISFAIDRWRRDRGLGCVRDKSSLEQLPLDEALAWADAWADLDSLSNAAHEGEGATTRTGDR